MDNPRTFFDIAIDGEPAGRIAFELYKLTTPKTVENFRCLCTGEKGSHLHYKGATFHRVVEGFVIQGGDFTKGDGTGGASIYGDTFDDEDFTRKHDRPFLLSMANRGPHTNSSQFFITTAPISDLDGKHVVFGHVVSGQDIVRRIDEIPTNDKEQPLQKITIANCGELERKKKQDSDKRKSTSDKKGSSKKRRRRPASRSSSSPSDSSSSSSSEAEGGDKNRTTKRDKKKSKKKPKKHRDEADIDITPSKEKDEDDQANAVEIENESLPIEKHARSSIDVPAEFLKDLHGNHDWRRGIGSDLRGDRHRDSPRDRRDYNDQSDRNRGNERRNDWGRDKADKNFGRENRDREFGRDNKDREFGRENRDREFGRDNRDREFGRDSRDRDQDRRRDNPYGWRPENSSDNVRDRRDFRDNRDRGGFYDRDRGRSWNDGPRRGGNEGQGERKDIQGRQIRGRGTTHYRPSSSFEPKETISIKEKNQNGEAGEWGAFEPQVRHHSSANDGVGVAEDITKQDEMIVEI